VRLGPVLIVVKLLCGQRPDFSRPAAFDSPSFRTLSRRRERAGVRSNVPLTFLTLRNFGVRVFGVFRGSKNSLEHFKYKCGRMLFSLGERDRLGRTRRRLAEETFYGCVFI